ncbi:MAG: DUF2946 family protein [Pseudomonadota bacterium]
MGWLSVILLLLGQAGPAISDQIETGVERSADMIVICTPTGLIVIEWDFGGGDQPLETIGPLCPLCISVASVSWPQVTVTRPENVRYHAYAVPRERRLAAFADVSPYAVRAPPV